MQCVDRHGAAQFTLSEESAAGRLPVVLDAEGIAWETVTIA